MPKLLILAANPSDARRDAHVKELRAVTRAIRAAPEGGAFDVMNREATRFPELKKMLATACRPAATGARDRAPP